MVSRFYQQRCTIISLPLVIVGVSDKISELRIWRILPAGAAYLSLDNIPDQEANTCPSTSLAAYSFCDLG